MVSSNIHQTPTIMILVSKLQKWIGINPVNTNFGVHYIFKILTIFGLMWSLIPEATFFINNLHDVKVCTSVMVTLGQLITTVIKVIYLAIRNRSYFNLFLTFESTTMQRRTVSGRDIFYDEAEKASSRLTKWWAIFIIVCAIAYLSPPLAYQIYLFIVQNDVDEPTYLSPFKHVYFYSVNSNLVYIITILMGILSTIVISITVLCIDGALFAYCVYIQAFFKDLQTMFKLNATQDNVAQLKDAIKFHTDILKMIGQLNNLFSPIIFGQFLNSTLMISTVVFQSTLKASLQVEIIKYYIFVIAVASQILFYSYIGTTISNESYNIAMAAYSSEWTDTDLKHKVQIRKYILFIIHRSQKEEGLDGLKLFRCNLQTFISIMKFSFSTLTVLQSMSN